MKEKTMEQIAWEVKDIAKKTEEARKEKDVCFDVIIREGLNDENAEAFQIKFRRYVKLTHCLIAAQKRETAARGKRFDEKYNSRAYRQKAHVL